MFATGDLLNDLDDCLGTSEPGWTLGGLDGQKD